MSFDCCSRIAVTGPSAEVLRFRRDARRRLSPSLKRSLDVAVVPFSLESLFRRNHLSAPPDVSIPKDEWDYFTSASRVRQWQGYKRTEYRVNFKSCEVYELLLPLSRSYAELCFVEAQISLDDGEVCPTYLAGGRCSRWILPEERCDLQWQRAARAYGIASLEEAYEDDIVRSDAEEGMLAEALCHWDQRVLRALRRRNSL